MSGIAVFFLIIGILYAISYAISIIIFIYELKHAYKLDPDAPFFIDEVWPDQFDKTR